MDEFKAATQAHAAACRACFDSSVSLEEFRAEHLTTYRSAIASRTRSARRSSHWIAPRIEELRRLAQTGLTAGDIATSMNCSRNSVLGKARRIGLQIGRRS